MKNNGIKHQILKLWFKTHDVICLHKIKKEFPVSIMTSEQTIAYIKKTNCSIARYGDGEFDLMMQVCAENYQNISDELSSALRNVFQNQSEHLLICLPHPIVSTKRLKKHGKAFWRGWCIKRQKRIVSELRSLKAANYRFGDAFVSRPYSGYQSEKYSQKLFGLLKELWEGRNILFVEGYQTRLGVGNDLFSNAKSIKRILCPAENAFNVYEKILGTIADCWQGELVVLALGPTATVLASDLSRKGVQALDLGHIDIQYEWYLAGTSYVPVKGKYTNETLDGRQPEACEDESYLSQIISVIK